MRSGRRRTQSNTFPRRSDHRSPSSCERVRMAGPSFAIIWVVVLAIIIFAIVLVARRYTRSRIIELPNLEDNQAFIRWLMEYEDWYTTSAKRHHRTLYWFRPAPIVIGFLVAIVSAMDNNLVLFKSYIPKNIIVISLTGLAALCVAVLTQLGVIDLSRTREIGRINCAALVARAQLFFSKTQTADDAYREKSAIVQEVFRIEHDQAALFSRIAGNVPDAQTPQRSAPRNPPAGGTGP
jgi:hypothetical protein